MAKSKVLYSCTECGAQTPKWSGQCGECGAWNALTEVASFAAGASRPRANSLTKASTVHRLRDIHADEVPRFPSGLAEFDRVLGGGLVPGAVVLLGGDPGIGKSTLLLQCLAAMADAGELLYVTGEESLEQVGLRAQRLGVGQTELHLLAETQLETVLGTAQSVKPRIMVIDSIQTMFTDVIQSAPGAVAQVRECAAQLVRYAKQTQTAVFLVGHVTKEGALAGPRVLEHMVDTVLYFEGDSSSRYRLVRAMKNRFGAVNELGVFAMTDKGLKPVSNPSAIFLSRHEQPVPGSAIMVTLEGSRPLLVEVQALVDESPLQNPRRVTVGLEHNRLAMLLAVLHRHGGIVTHDQDVFANVVGGVRVSETAVDLPLLLAVLSSLRNRPLPSQMVVFGEVGLAGELRPVSNGQERLHEAVKHGFKQALIPAANAPRKPVAGLEVKAVQNLSEALDSV